jgi:hypothetical protein
MKNNFSISYKKNYVEATSDGPKTQECITQMWRKIINTCKDCTWLHHHQMMSNKPPVQNHYY